MLDKPQIRRQSSDRQQQQQKSLELIQNGAEQEQNQRGIGIARVLSRKNSIQESTSPSAKNEQIMATIAKADSDIQRKMSLQGQNSYGEERNSALLASGGSIGDRQSFLASHSSSSRYLRDNRLSVTSTTAAAIAASASGSEKPTLLLYPRKSFLSGSIRDFGSIRAAETVPVATAAAASSYGAPGAKAPQELAMSSSSASLMGRSLGRPPIGTCALVASLSSSINASSAVPGAISGSEMRRSIIHVAPDGQVSISRAISGSSGSITALAIQQNRRSDLQILPELAASQQQQQQPGRQSRPVSILSLKTYNVIKSSTSVLAYPADPRATDEGATAQAAGNPPPPSNEYYDYIMLAQRHSSSNFIQQAESADILWERKALPLKMIGMYLLGDKIGKGAFGKVKEGVNSETLQRVAVKIISRKRLRKITNGLENVIREIRMLRKLKHQNIVTLMDVFAKVEDQSGNTGIFPWFATIEEEPIVWLYDDGREEEKQVKVLKWYLVFEFCPCTLQMLLEQCEGNKLNIPQAHWYFVQLMDGIQYLHSQSIIHRDIKPGNMLITSDGILKISDFGVAEQFNSYSEEPMRSEVFAGTHQFLSPEIADGSNEFDAEKVDAWACGVTLYNMISGTYPFEFDADGNLLELYEKIMTGVYQMPKEATHELADLLQGMLTKDPQLRLSVLGIQAHAWTKTVFGLSRKLPYIPTFHYSDPDLASPPEAELKDHDGARTAESSPTKRIDSPDVDELEKDSSAAPPAREDSPENKTRPVESSGADEPETDPDTPDNKVDDQDKPSKLTPCETTMIPFLSAMYQSELEAEFAAAGTILDLSMGEGL